MNLTDPTSMRQTSAQERADEILLRPSGYGIHASLFIIKFNMMDNSSVMTGLVPAIHVEPQQIFASSKCGSGPTWITGTSPAMTGRWCYLLEIYCRKQMCEYRSPIGRRGRRQHFPGVLPLLRSDGAAGSSTVRPDPRQTRIGMRGHDTTMTIYTVRPKRYGTRYQGGRSPDGC
jgi:hypothetical protein